MSMMVSFVLSFFPRDVLDEILNLIESVLGVFLPTLLKANNLRRFKIVSYISGLTKSNSM